MVTTIQLSHELKEKIANFGSKNETYEEILERLYDMAIETQLRKYLMSDENTITIEKDIKEAERKWPMSK